MYVIVHKKRITIKFVPIVPGCLETCVYSEFFIIKNCMLYFLMIFNAISPS